MAANTRFGWHSGTMRCRDAKILGDIYIQDDIIFSDVSAGTLGVTGGIDMTGTTSAIGINFTGITAATGVMMCGTGTSATQTMAEAEDFVLGIYTTCTDTDGANTAKPLYVNANYSGAGQVARAAEFVLRPTAQMGGWCNAVKGYTDFSVTATGGGSTGLASAVCSEMRLPNGACAGAFYPLEVEWVGQTSTAFSTPGSGSQSGFIFLAASGTVTDMNADGVFMSVGGLTAGATALLSQHSQTLKCNIGASTTRYLLLSQETDCLSLAYTNSIAEAVAITVTSGDTVTTGMSMSGAGVYTTGIKLDATGIMTDGILISATTPVDGIHISSACSGHMINLSGASTGNGLTISGATSDTGIEVSGTCTNFAIDVSGAQTAAGISVAGTCGSDGLVISGACTISAIHISGDQAIAMLVDVDGALATGISFAVDNGVTMTTGIDMTCTGTGTVTNAISLTYTNSASNGILMDMADAEVLDAGIRMDGAGTYTDGILFDGDNFVDCIHVTGTPSSYAMHFAQATGTSLYMGHVQAAGQHFIDMIDAYTGRVIETGTYDSSASKGVTLSATNFRPVTFVFDDGGADLGNANYRGVLSRIYLAETQTGQVAIRAIRGQLKVASTKDLTIATNEMNALNGVEGYIEMAGTHTVGANSRVAAVHGLLEVNDDITLTAGGYMCGLFAELSQVTAKTVSGVGTCGLMIDRLDADHTTNQALWTRGIVIQDGACTTGIDIGTATTGIEFSGTVTEGIVFSAATLSPGSTGGDSSRALEIGSRTDEFTLVFAGGDGVENFEPIQTKVDITGTNPASVSKINMIYQQITHDTTDMSNLRIKASDWTITVGKDCQDVYVSQGEISTGNASGVTCSGEVAVHGLVLDAGSQAVTCPAWRVINATIRGAGTPAASQGVFVNVETGATADAGIQLQCAGTLTNAIRIGNSSYGESPTNLFAFPAEGTAPVSDTTNVVFNTDPVKISILVGGVQYYMLAAKDFA